MMIVFTPYMIFLETLSILYFDHEEIANEIKSLHEVFYNLLSM